jgi:putative lipoprotein
MKLSNLLLGCALALPLVSTLPVQAQTKTAKRPASHKILRGEAFFLERILLPPRAKLHVSLVGRVAGAEYLPLATAIVPARSGSTPFQLSVPTAGLPAGPYRIQAWIVGDNRVMFQGRMPQTTVNSLDKIARIRLSPVAAPVNIDGIGDGKSLPRPQVKPVPLPRPVSNTEYKLSGQVSKLDRRGLMPNAKVIVELRDVSLQDAPSKLLGTSEIELNGKQLPASYDMTLVGFDLDPRGRYAVSAKVFEDGKVSYLSDTNFAFDASKHKQTVNVRVVAAR